MADWAVHTCRQRHKEADSWAGTGVKGRDEEWVDTANVVWSGDDPSVWFLGR